MWQVIELDPLLRWGRGPVASRTFNALMGLAAQPATVLGQGAANHTLDEFGIPRSMRGAGRANGSGQGSAQVCSIRDARDTVHEECQTGESTEMPRKSAALKASEERFVEHFSEHGSREEAEAAAGMAPGSGYDMLARPEIRKMIVQRENAVLLGDALPLAMSTIIEIMQNSKAPASARVQAAKIVLDRAMPQDEVGREKELHEMTPEEIAERIARLEGLTAALARNTATDAPKAPIFS